METEGFKLENFNINNRNDKSLCKICLSIIETNVYIFSFPGQNVRLVKIKL